MCAAEKGDTAYMRLLIDRGEGKRQDKEGRTALMLAVEMGYAEGVKLLADKESGVQDKNGITALMRAASKGDVDSVELLAPAEYNIRDNSGDSAIHYAVRGNRVDCVRSLLNQESNGCNERTYAAFEIARQYKLKEIIMVFMVFYEKHYFYKDRMEM